MQTFEISLYVNVALATLVLYFVYPKVIQHYRNKKRLRETQKKKQIEKIVLDYLKSLKQ